MHACACSVASDSLRPHGQAPLSMEVSRQEYWSGLPFPSPGDLSDLGIEPASPVFLTLSADTQLSHWYFQFKYSGPLKELTLLRKKLERTKELAMQTSRERKYSGRRNRKYKGPRAER